MFISYYLPDTILTNEDLAGLYQNWTPEKILEKTGISQRHISGSAETVADMAVTASQKLFSENNIKPEVIEFIILATQTPDYRLPTTACIVQDRLNIKSSAGAVDINLGCSAFIYGLALAKSLLENGTVRNVLLIMSEQYSKHIHDMDKSTRTIFGDGASAVFLEQEDVKKIGKFVFGTDGSGYDKLIIPAGGGRNTSSEETGKAYQDDSGNIRSADNLFMDGAEIFNFTIRSVPAAVKTVLAKNDLVMDDIDLFVFHQANKFMLDYLKKLIKIPSEKLYINMQDIGNTVSATIPIALKRAETDNSLKKGYKVMLVGFGVGFSWGATIIEY